MFVFQIIAVVALLAFAARFAFNFYRVAKSESEAFRIGVWEYTTWGVTVGASLIAIFLGMS